MKGTGEALREEKSQCRSGKASRMFIISLPLKPSRVSQGLKEKSELLILPFMALQMRPYILSGVNETHYQRHKMTNKCGEKAKGYLCDGKVQPDIDDDSEEQNVESSHHQQWLLQHEHFVERVVDLGEGTNKEDWLPKVCKDSDTWEQQRGLSRPTVMQAAPHTPRGDYTQSPAAQGG